MNRAPRRPGFNEAPASLPGKGGRVNRPSAGGPGASMRPRQVCRGKEQASRGREGDYMRFNEAPASLPGKAAPRASRRSRGFCASMRPRQVCRGKARGRDGAGITTSPLQ